MLCSQKNHAKDYIIQVSPSSAVNPDQINRVIAKSLFCFEIQRHPFRDSVLHVSKQRGYF